MNNYGQLSEQKLAEKIIHFHDILGYGFRKISRELKKEGIEVGKDKAWRLYHKYKKDITLNEDKELIALKTQEKELSRRREIARAKNEKRWSIATLLLREADDDFERRIQLFQDKNSLLDFARKILPLTNPDNWIRFIEFCKNEKMRLADALHEAVGSQVDYEEIRRESLSEDCEYFLDEYLSACILDWLLLRQREKLKNKPNISIDVIEDSYVMIPLD